MNKETMPMMTINRLVRIALEEALKKKGRCVNGSVDSNYYTAFVNDGSKDYMYVCSSILDEEFIVKLYNVERCLLNKNKSFIVMVDYMKDLEVTSKQYTRDVDWLTEKIEGYSNVKNILEEKGLGSYIACDGVESNAYRMVSCMWGSCVVARGVSIVVGGRLR